MAETVGVSRSTVSRESIEASEAALQQLMERRFEDLDVLIIYLDGMHFANQCVLAAVGVDVQGRKHVLALREGATENAEAAKDLLQHPVERGIDPARRRLFIIDGSSSAHGHQRGVWCRNSGTTVQKPQASPCARATSARAAGGRPRRCCGQPGR